MIMDFTTDYLNLELKSPLVVSASPLSESLGNIRKMEDYGASAIVLYSLFEEQLILEQQDIHYLTTEGTESFAEATTYFPEPEDYRMGPEKYLDHIRKCKEAVDIPIIPSLNGHTLGGWTDFAKQMEDAGADALELNVYYIPNNLDDSSEAVEQNYVDILKSVKSAVSIPVSIKLSPYFSNMANMAKKLDEAGADGLVLFNRFYQPDIDLEELEIVPNVMLSKSYDVRLPMRWIAILKGRIQADLAATSGIHTGYDVIKLMMVGANVAMLNSILLKRGIQYIQDIKYQMYDWMEEKEYDSVKQMLGSMSQQNVPDPLSFERAQYMRALTQFDWQSLTS